MSETIPPEERLFHNLHPADYDNGRINSTAFNPSGNHDYKLSIDRSAIFGPEKSYEVFTARGNVSVGVCGVQCSDFSGEDVDCHPDPLPENEAHALADFSPHGSNQRHKRAKRLARKALDYGLDFKPK